MTERLLMRQVREILRLKYEQGLVHRPRRGAGAVYEDAGHVLRALNNRAGTKRETPPRSRMMS